MYAHFAHVKRVCAPAALKRNWPLAAFEQQSFVLLSFKPSVRLRFGYSTQLLAAITQSIVFDQSLVSVACSASHSARWSQKRKQVIRTSVESPTIGKKPNGPRLRLIARIQDQHQSFDFNGKRGKCNRFEKFPLCPAIGVRCSDKSSLWRASHHLEAKQTNETIKISLATHSIWKVNKFSVRQRHGPQQMNFEICEFGGLRKSTPISESKPAKTSAKLFSVNNLARVMDNEAIRWAAMSVIGDCYVKCQSPFRGRNAQHWLATFTRWWFSPSFPTKRLTLRGPRTQVLNRVCHRTAVGG